MSTSDQNRPQLTRKQLRELRLTGSTPVINEPVEEPVRHEEPVIEEPVDEEPVARRGPIHHIVDDVIVAPVRDRALREEPASESAPEPAVAPVADEDAPRLTRRQMREQERIRTGSLPVQDEPADAPGMLVPDAEASESLSDGDAVKSIFDAPTDEPELAEPAKPMIAGLPAFGPVEPEPVLAAPVLSESESELDSAPEVPAPVAAASKPAEERPKVGAAFGIGVKDQEKSHSLPTAFEDLIDNGTSGSHRSSSTLIFTPSPGVGSLSGPIASTGELLVTGSYSLPDGLGSRGHARGTTDGREADAVLIDGELAATSSPTPIAASSAISTLKPAGEVIRPPAPDKSGKLTLTLAIVAGGLGLALAAVIAIAAFTGVFS